MATIEAGQLLAKAVDEPDEMDTAKEKAVEVLMLTEFLRLLDAATSGKDESSESRQFEYIEVLLTVPKT